jgi:iron complex outermembrane receptor protein
MVFGTKGIWLWIGVLGWSMSLAQSKPCDCQLKGVIKDQDTRLPIPGAVIWIKELKQASVADARGAYSFEKLCQGQYTLVCRILGYKERTLRLSISHAQQQDLSLSDDDIHLQDVTVRAQRVEQFSQPTAVLSDEDLDQTRGQTLGEALKTITGVMTLQTGGSIVKPVIHGMHSNRVLILNNGVRQEGQQWGAEHAPEIDPFTAQRISVVKGAAGVRYGSDAIGGVILTEPEALPDSVGVSGEVNLVGFSNGRQGVVSTTVQGGNAKWQGFGWRVQGTLKRGGDLQTPTYYMLNTGVAEQNFSLSTGIRRRRWGTEWYMSQFSTRIGIFAGAHIGSTTDLRAAIERGTPDAAYAPAQFSYQINRPYQNVAHNLLKSKTYWRPSPAERWSLTLSRQYNYRAEYDITRRNQGASQRFQLITWVGDLLWEHKPTKFGISGMIGGTLSYQQNITTGQLRQPTTKTVFIPNYQQWSGGVFVIERFVKKHWDAEMGLRYDWRQLQRFEKTVALVSDPRVDETQASFRNLSATFGASVRITSALAMKWQAASAWRPPSINELYADGVHHGAAAFELGNPEMRSETAYNLSWTTEYHTKRLALELNLYHNFIRNFIYLQPQDSLRLTVRGAFPLYRYQQVNAVFRGFDASATWLMGKGVSFTTKYAFLSVRDVLNDAYLVWIPANRLDNTLKYSFASGKSFVSLGYLWVAKQRKVEPNSDFASPPPAYTLWSMQAGGQVKLGGRVVEVGFGITNLLNVKYREYLNRFRYFTDDPGRNVSLRLKYVF